MDRELAVKVAKDVIKQLRVKKYVAQRGAYVGSLVFRDDFVDYYNAANHHLNFRDNFKQIKDCRVCALGAALCSYVHLENKYSIREVVHFNPIANPISNPVLTLNAVFGKENLQLMEFVFERAGNGVLFNLIMNTHDFIFRGMGEAQLIRLTNKYTRKYKKDAQLLRAIMLNVIRNNGEFKFPKRMK